MYRLLFDSKRRDIMMHEAVTIARELRKNGVPIEIIDTANWNDKEKLQFYYDELVPLSLKTRKRLRGYIRTHRSGTIIYHLVLVAEDNFYVGDEAIKKLMELRNYA